MQRHQRHLQAKTDQAKKEKHPLPLRWQRRHQQRAEIEAAAAAAGNDEGNQQWYPTGEHDQEIPAGGRRATAGDRPAAEQEINRDQRQFPENKEQDQVVGTENPQRCRLQAEEQAEIQSVVVGIAIPGRDQRPEKQQRG